MALLRSQSVPGFKSQFQYSWPALSESQFPHCKMGISVWHMCVLDLRRIRRQNMSEDKLIIWKADIDLICKIQSHCLLKCYNTRWQKVSVPNTSYALPDILNNFIPYLDSPSPSWPPHKLVAKVLTSGWARRLQDPGLVLQLDCWILFWNFALTPVIPIEKSVFNSKSAYSRLVSLYQNN